MQKELIKSLKYGNEHNLNFDLARQIILAEDIITFGIEATIISLKLIKFIKWIYLTNRF